MDDRPVKERDSELEALQREYQDRPFVKFVKSEGYLFLIPILFVLAFVIYKKYFQKIDIITGENVAKYVRVLNDFDSFIEDFESEINQKREEKKKNEKVRIDITPYKTRLYQIYDFMYVQKIAPESPFYKDYSKEEKLIINRLMDAGRRLDKIVIEIYNFNGDPFTMTDFEPIKRMLEEIRSDLKRYAVVK